jgi:hypothetical protein
MKWKFGSRRWLAVSTWSVLALLAVLAFAFYQMQNRLQPVGGAISVEKMAWLALAVLQWVMLPALLCADTRLSNMLLRPFKILLLLMLMRGVIEGGMLYVTLNWSPWYGIAHDLLCAGVLVWFALHIHATSALERLVRGYMFVALLAFAPEIYFAWYMQAHFVTVGDQAIYFVPDDPAYADVLLVTRISVIFFGICTLIFCWRWLHGRSERASASSD